MDDGGGDIANSMIDGGCDSDSNSSTNKSQLQSSSMNREGKNLNSINPNRHLNCFEIRSSDRMRLN